MADYFLLLEKAYGLQPNKNGILEFESFFDVAFEHICTIF